MARDTKNNRINNTELVVLGLVAEGPKYGYQVEQDIAQRGMREWTEIGFSSIYYVLNKLEAFGWLESRIEAGAADEKRGPARKIYAVTENGWKIYRIAVRERLLSPRPRTADFALALANLPAVPSHEAREVIKSQLAKLTERKRIVQEKKMHDRLAAGELPAHVEALFSYSQALMTSEIEWLANFLESEIFEKRGDSV